MNTGDDYEALLATKPVKHVDGEIAVERRIRRGRRKLAWPHGRALTFLIQTFRVHDRMAGSFPLSSLSNPTTWQTPVRRTAGGFAPGSRSFNAAYDRVAQQFAKRLRGLNSTPRRRWIIATMTKEIRRRVRDA